MPSGSSPLVGSSRTRTCGVADQRGGEAEPLVHAEREAADPAVGRSRQLDQLEHLVDARAAHAGLGGDDAQVVAGGAPRVRRASSIAPTSRSGSAIAAYGRPPIVRSPSVGVTRPSSARSVVVFPEPFGPEERRSRRRARR